MQTITLEQQPFQPAQGELSVESLQAGKEPGSKTAFADFCRGLGAESFEFIVNHKYA